MQFIVIDLEWNQYPVGTRAPVARTGVVMMNEIVQIGALRTDERFHVLDRFSVNVRLPGNRKLSRQVARVISCSQEEIDQGMDFSDAYRRLLAFVQGAQGVLSWGVDDQKVLASNAQYYRLPVAEIPWYDAQCVYRAQLTGENPRTSLESAMEHFQIDLGGRTQHDALSDAEATAAVLSKMNTAQALSHYQDYEVVSTRRGLASGATPTFLKRGQAREHARALAFSCPVCGQTLKSQNLRFGRRENWQELYACPAHGEYMVKMHLRCRSERYYSVLFSIHPLDEGMRRAAERKRRRAEAQRQAAAPAEQPGS